MTIAGSWRAFILAAALALCPARAAAGEPDWAAPYPAIAKAIEGGRPVVVHVTVPLCSNDQIDCGASWAGRPGDLDKNLYWGAIFGLRTFFDRPHSGYERIEVRRDVPGVLERAVYRRLFSGEPWGRDEPVEQIVVLEAHHGDHIDRAVDRFWSVATNGAVVSFEHSGESRAELVSVAGYAGHNRLMDGKRLPAPSPAGAALPSFVMACASEGWFGEPLRRAGSDTLVMTRDLVAPEGYVVQAIAEGLAARASRRDLRTRAVTAYASWQRIDASVATTIFH